MFLESIGSEIFSKVFKMKNVNNFPSIDARDMKIPPFDASPHDDSNELYFVLL
jgi:hypothetical protein